MHKCEKVIQASCIVVYKVLLSDIKGWVSILIGVTRPEAAFYCYTVGNYTCENDHFTMTNGNVYIIAILYPGLDPKTFDRGSLNVNTDSNTVPWPRP